MKRLKVGKRAVLLGIGGSGMKGLAKILMGIGLKVEGTDANVNSLKKLKEAGYEVCEEGAGREMVARAEVIIYSDALPPSHNLREYGQSLGIFEMGFNEALGELSREGKTIAVCGTHGKTTTTAMLAKILVDQGMAPTVLVGAGIKEWDYEHARIGEGDYFVMEADEYRDHFLAFSPLHIIVTSIDFDHPDYFSSLDQVKESYRQFLARLPDAGSAVVAERVWRQFPDLGWPADLILVNADQEKLEVDRPGKHWRSNAALAVAMAERLGVERSAARMAVKEPWGITRRMELIGQAGEMPIYSDYGHHPEEIRVTLQGIKEDWPGKKVVVVVEVHTPQRLFEFKKEYVAALQEADEIVITPVFIPKGREMKIEKQVELTVVEMASDLKGQGNKVSVIKEYGDIVKVLGEREEDWVAVIFSAGNLDAEIRKIYE